MVRPTVSNVVATGHGVDDHGLRGADAARGLAESGGAALEGVTLVRGHARLELTGRARAPDDGRQRDRNAVALAVGRHRQDDALVTEDRLGYLGAGGADAELAGAVALDDRDVRETDLVLDPPAQVVERAVPAVPAERLGQRRAPAPH